MQALPVLRHIKRHLPESQVYWWVESKLMPLLEGDPDLAGVVRFSRRGWLATRNWRELWDTIRWMREQRFDWVVDLQCLARSGTFAWLANGEFTVGLDEAREGARGFYDRVARRPSFHTHAVDWYLRVLPMLGVPADKPFEWLPGRAAVAAEVRRKWPVGQARWVLFQPGARWPNKRWPTEYFAELLRRATALPDEYRFAVLGGEEDRPLGQCIAAAAPQRCLDLSGRLSLPELVEWLRLSELIVTNDTGPMHLGAALGKPMVALFGPTEPRRTGPYGQLGQVLQESLPCVPCLKSHCAWHDPLACLRGLTPERVWSEMRQRLGRD